MGKIRDLFEKIRDTKGTFHAKMGSIKDRNGRDLTEADDIKKRWQTLTCFKHVLNIFLAVSSSPHPFCTSSLYKRTVQKRSS